VDGQRHLAVGDLARGIDAGAALRDLVFDDVEADRSHLLAELDDERQTDLAQTDDGYCRGIVGGHL
jgi:hypothetical protein